MRGGPEFDADGMRATFGRRRPAQPLDDLPARDTAPAETFAVPVELVLYAVNATGQMFLRRWREKGASFATTAKVWRMGDRLIADVAFRWPVGPEKQTGLIVQLGVHLWESLAEDAR